MVRLMQIAGVLSLVLAAGILALCIRQWLRVDTAGDAVWTSSSAVRNCLSGQTGHSVGPFRDSGGSPRLDRLPGGRASVRDGGRARGRAAICRGAGASDDGAADRADR
jgi:hypothetical protein